MHFYLNAFRWEFHKITYFHTFSNCCGPFCASKGIKSVIEWNGSMCHLGTHFSRDVCSHKLKYCEENFELHNGTLSSHYVPKLLFSFVFLSSSSVEPPKMIPSHFLAASKQRDPLGSSCPEIQIRISHRRASFDLTCCLLFNKSQP